MLKQPFLISHQADPHPSLPPSLPLARSLAPSLRTKLVTPLFSYCADTRLFSILPRSRFRAHTRAFSSPLARWWNLPPPPFLRSSHPLNGANSLLWNTIIYQKCITGTSGVQNEKSSAQSLTVIIQYVAGVCVLRQRAVHSWPSSDAFCWVVPQILASSRFLLCAELIFPSSRRWKPEAELMLLGSQEVHTHTHTSVRRTHTHPSCCAQKSASF